MKYFIALGLIPVMTVGCSVETTSSDAFYSGCLCKSFCWWGCKAGRLFVPDQ